MFFPIYLILLVTVQCLSETFSIRSDVRASHPFRNLQVTPIYQETREHKNSYLEDYETNEINIGRSPCQTGQLGDECRRKLVKNAMKCTSGQCYECQKCHKLKPIKWMACCRDHFLCCRELVRSCHICQHSQLHPFCRVAYRRCNL